MLRERERESERERERERERGRQAGRQTETETERERQRQRETQTDKQTDRQTERNPPKTLTNILSEHCANALPVDQHTLLPHSEVTVVVAEVRPAEALRRVANRRAVTVRVPDHPVGTEEADHVEDQGHDQHGDAHLQKAVRFSHVLPASSRQLADEDGAALKVVAAAFYVFVVVHRYSAFSFVSALYR